MKKLKEDLSRKLGHLRALQRIVFSIEFEEFYDASDQLQRDKIEQLIAREDRDALIRLIKCKETDLSSKSVRQLRLMCRARNIRNAHILSKAALLSILESLGG